MAVIQISRIQHRRGIEADLPNPGLAEAELGFTKDTGRLFIGSPDLPFVASRTTFPFKNTEVLTEWSDFSGDILNHEYLYREITDCNNPYDNPGLRQTTEAWTNLRQFQERLDEFVSVKDYGAVGDGICDDTEALLRAILDVTRLNVGRFRRLYFPAGIYRIIRPLVLPPRSVWIGDGIASIQSGLSEAFALESNTVIFLDTGDINFNASFAPAVVRTADAGIMELLGGVGDPANFDSTIHTQLGLQIGANGHDLPEDIMVAGIKFTTDGILDVVRLDRTSRVKFLCCGFQSGYNCDSTSKGIGDKYVEADDSIAVRIDGLGAVIDPTDLVFADCHYSNVTYGYFVTDEVKNVTVSNPIFENMFKAVTLGEDSTYGGGYAFLGELTSPNNQGSPVASDGPLSFRVMNARYDRIQDSGFSVFSVNAGNMSLFSRFDEVGHDCPGSPPVAGDDPLVANVVFGSGTVRNMCIGDSFFYTGASDDLRVDFDLADSNLIICPPVFFAPFSPGTPVSTGTVVLVDNQAGASTSIIFDVTTNNSVIIEYGICRGESYRTGVLTIIAHPDGTSGVSFTDNFTEIGDVSGSTVGSGVILDVQLIAGFIEIFYNTTDEAPDIDGTFTWSSRSWLTTN